MKMKMGKKGAAVTGVAAIAVLVALLGSGTFGIGTGSDLTGATGASNKEESAVVETVATTQENPETTVEAVESQAAVVEIRIQGRTYNYQNVTYGSGEHPLDELLNALKEFPPDTRIDLVVEDDATKNAVDDLERALAEAGFRNIVK